MENPALLLMVKNPIAGKTKTRLAAEVGNDRALEIYGKLIRHTREQASGLQGVTRYLYYSDFVDSADEWPGDEYIKLVQLGAGLGERMSAAFQRAFDRGHERVVIIGSDCPGLSADLLRESFSALLENDLVIGPASDGGYYLLGLRHPQPRLFTDMAWSTENVAAETLRRAQVQALRVSELPTLSDVDRLADWEACQLS